MSVEFLIVPPQEENVERCTTRGRFYFRVLVDGVPVMLGPGRFEDPILTAEISANYDVSSFVCTSDRLVLHRGDKEFFLEPKTCAEWQAMKPLLEPNLCRLGLAVARRWIESAKETRSSTPKDLTRIGCTEPQIQVLFELQREPQFSSGARTLDGYAWFVCLAPIPAVPITVTSLDGKLSMSCGYNVHATNSKIRFSHFGKIPLPGLGKEFNSDQAEDLFRKMAVKLLEQEKPQGVKTWSLVPVTSLQLQ